MGAQNMPEAEVAITEDLVRRLLVEQHPDLGALALTPLANGWDNVLFRLGDELTVRLPRRAMAAQLVQAEIDWLPVLAPRLPLPVPAPARVGTPSDAYPWSWTILPWFEGQAVGVTSFADPSAQAQRLGGFLAALHQPAPDDAPVNPFRGGPLADRDQMTLERIDSVAEHLEELGISAEAVRLAWAEASSAPLWNGPPLWVHGDLHPLNMVGREGELVAIIDFGDMTGGDPATDLLVAWALFDRDHRAIFRAAAESATRPIDDAMWERGRGWAISHAMAVLALSADNPALHEVSVRTLRRAIGSRAIDDEL